MAEDARIPPSPARLAMAWRVGLRPSSSRLVPALLCLMLAAALPRTLDARLSAALRAAWAGSDVYVLLDMVVTTLPMVLLLVTALAVTAAVATGTFGWVDGSRSRLGRVGAVRAGGSDVVVGVGIVVVLGLALRGVIAGAARGVDASEVGLATAWIEWIRRVLAAGGVALLIAAVLEVVARRRALRGALHQTRVEAEEQAG